MWRHLQDLFIVLGVLLIAAVVFVSWAIFVTCAYTFTYLILFATGYWRVKK